MLTFAPGAPLPWPASDVHAVIFDLDGTITVPVLDFDAIRREIGVSGLLLEEIEKLDETGRQRAVAIIERHERAAAENSQLHDGVDELLALIEGSKCRTGLVTRNSRVSVDLVALRHDLRFDTIVTRDDAPIKPSPEPLWLACRHLAVPPEQALWIGDGFIDRDTGLAAGIRTIIVGRSEDVPGVLYVDSPGQLLGMLRTG